MGAALAWDAGAYTFLTFSPFDRMFAVADVATAIP